MTQEAVEAVAPVTPDHVRPKDFLLDHLIFLINNDGYELPVTLQIGGMLVSGTAIAGDKFFSEWATTFSNSMNGSEEDKTLIRESFAKYGQVYIDQRSPDAPFPVAPYTFIHLRDALYFVDNKPISSKGVLWRGLVSDVSGWHYGRFEQVKEPA